jgi:hypothetical protein
VPRINARLSRADHNAAFGTYYRNAEQRIEIAALRATDRARRTALQNIRSEMQAAGLGRLGNALGSTSDFAEGRGVHRRAGGGFSASGTIFIRSRSPRSRGAIEAYTEGANIRPVRSRWLWIATDQIPRVTARQRMTPELYRKNGFERKIGPLVQIKSASGTPLLIVRDVGLSMAGKARSARSLKKSGLPRRGQYHAQAIIAFYGIPNTARAARIDPRAMFDALQAQLPSMWQREMER